MRTESPGIRQAEPPAPSVGNQASGTRASLNQALWRELQALRPNSIAKIAKTETGTFTPAAFDKDDADAAAARAANLRKLFGRIGQLGKDGSDLKDEAPLSALCFSGGGIRSATFNLGVLQALAGARL